MLDNAKFFVAGEANKRRAERSVAVYVTEARREV